MALTDYGRIIIKNGEIISDNILQLSGKPDDVEFLNKYLLSIIPYKTSIRKVKDVHLYKIVLNLNNSMYNKRVLRNIKIENIPVEYIKKIDGEIFHMCVKDNNDTYHILFGYDVDRYCFYSKNTKKICDKFLDKYVKKEVN